MLEVKRLVMGSMQSNCYILSERGSERAVVIDPGDCAERLIGFLSENGITVSHILLTHAHFDHIGAVDELCRRFDCEVILHEKDRELLCDPSLNLSKCFGCRVTANPKRLRTVSGGELELCGRSFEFIHTPGHSNGSACIRTDNMLFTGDTLFYLSVGNPFPPHGSLETELASIRLSLFTVNGDLLCYPGHGRETSLDFERKHNPYFNGE